MTSSAKNHARRRGFTLIELLVVILVIAILIAVAAPSFLGQQNKAYDSKTKQNLAVAEKNLKLVHVENEEYPAVGVIVSELTASEPQLSFVDWDGGNVISLADDNITVNREGPQQATVCALSRTNIVFCLTRNEQGLLAQESSALALESAYADNVTGRYAGPNEEAVRCRVPVPGEQDRSTFTETADYCQGVPGADEVVNSWSTEGIEGEEVQPTVQNISLPQITGDTVVGSTLLATEGTWVNAASYEYQWLRDDQEISGANTNSYVLVSEDVGTKVRVRVTATGTGGTSQALSDESATITEPSYEEIIADLSPTSFWTMDDSTGSTTITDTIGSNNLTKVSSGNFAETTGVEGAGSKAGSFTGSQEFSLANLPRTNNHYTLSMWLKNPVSFNGGNQTKFPYSFGGTNDTANHSMSAPGTWGFFGGGGSANISSAAGQAWYNLTVRQNADGRKLYINGILVSSTATLGTSSVFTLGGIAQPDHRFQGAIDNVIYFDRALADADLDLIVDYDLLVPTNNSSPQITGSNTVGSTLTASPGNWDFAETFDYQWQRADTSSGTWANISGATGSTYTVTGADDGKYVRVAVSVQNVVAYSSGKGINVAVGSETYASAVLADSPSGFWRLDGGSSVANEGSSGVSAIKAGSVSESADSPFSGTDPASKSALFASTGRYDVTAYPGINPTSSSYTIEFWIKAGPGAYNIIESYAGQGFGIRSSGWAGCSSGTVGILILAGGNPCVPEGSSMLNNQWHHVVFTVAPGTQRVYIDGVLSNSHNAATINTATGGIFRIGGRGDDGATTFNGRLTDVAYYNTALSGAQVASHYAAAN